MRAAALWLLVILPGVATVVVSGYFLLQDWAALNAAFVRFQQEVRSGAELRALFGAEAEQHVHRINCFAEGVGVLLGAILAAIGIHGLCTLPRKPGGKD
jgi:hypothetical protein